jgi:hypothetical protein
MWVRPLACLVLTDLPLPGGRPRRRWRAPRRALRRRARPAPEKARAG